MGANENVFCKYLGLPYYYASFTSLATANYADSLRKWLVSGQTNMDNVRCTGLEKSLEKCSYDYLNDCTHSEDVIVTCQWI